MVVWLPYSQVVENTHQKLWCEAQLATFSNSFMWLTAVLPYLVVAQRYFAGEIEFGVIAQVTVSDGKDITCVNTMLCTVDKLCQPVYL